MKKYFIFLLSFLSCFSVALFGQGGVRVSAAVDKEVIFIGEQTHLLLQANFPERATPSFFKIDSLPHFEVLHASKIDTQSTAGGVQLQQTLTLTSFDSGAWQLPVFTLPDVKTVRTKPIRVQVAFSPMDPKQDYHDIKDILEVPNPARTTWYWYAVGAVLLLLLIWLLFPKKKKGPVAEPAINLNAYKQALADMDKLKGKTSEDGKQYFTELVDIFRNYLQQRKGIQSHAQTTTDLSRQIKSLSLKEEEYKALVNTLQLSDFVKFAKYTPAVQEKEEALDTIRKSIIAIEQTKE